jgi:hypothetical protein
MTQANNPFEIHAVYIQVNTVKGNRYLDDAGKIMNRYSEDYEETNVDLRGLRFSTPRDSESLLPYQLTVDSSKIWMTYSHPARILTQATQILSIVRDISQEIGVSSYSRLGLRVQYFWPLELESPLISTFASRSLGESLQPRLQQMSGPIEFITQVRGQEAGTGLTSMVRVQTVRIARPPANLAEFSENGVMFDVDVVSDTVSRIDALRPFLGSASRLIEQQFASIGLEVFEVRK